MGPLRGNPPHSSYTYEGRKATVPSGPPPRSSLQGMKTESAFRLSPGAFNAERREVGGFAFIHMVLNKLIDAGAPRAAPQARAQVSQIVDRTRGHNFHVTVFGVAHPATEIEFAGLAVNKPAESHTLNTPANQEVKHHRRPVLQMPFTGRNRTTFPFRKPPFVPIPAGANDDAFILGGLI